MGEESLRAFRERFNIPIPDDQISSAPFSNRRADSAEMAYLHKHGAGAGRLHAEPPRTGQPADDPAAGYLQGVARRQRRPRDVDDDGVRAFSSPA